MPTVAVLGASADRSRFANKSVRAHLHAGWTVFPVHPRETEVEGLPVTRSLADLPGPLDRITLYLPPPATRAQLPAIAAAGAREVYFNPGTADPAILDEARALGIPVVDACSILALGLRPSQFP